jgi:hypothetical protein
VAQVNLLRDGRNLLDSRCRAIRRIDVVAEQPGCLSFSGTMPAG